MITIVNTLDQQSPSFLAPRTGFVKDSFSMDLEGCEGGWFRYWEPLGVADEALLAHLLLTPCCVAQFLTGHSPGVGDPCFRYINWVPLLFPFCRYGN